MSAAPGAHKCGFMNGRRQVLAGCPGCVPQERDPELAAAARSRLPGRVSVPSLAPTPWGGQSRGLSLRQGHRQSAPVSNTSGSVWEGVRRNGTFRGEPCLEEVVGLSSALPSVEECTRRAGRRIRQIPICSLPSGAGGEWVGASLRESDRDFGAQRSRSET